MVGAGHPARPTRVYVVELDRLPRTILTALLESEGEIRVIVDEDADRPGGPRTGAELIAWLAERSPDVVIVGGGDFDRLEGLIALLRARVLVLVDRGTQIYCSQLYPKSKVVGQVSPDDLLSLIRDNESDVAP